MTELALVGVILALLVERLLGQREHRRQVQELTNALVAKNAAELARLDRPPAPKRERPEREPRPATVGLG